MSKDLRAGRLRHLIPGVGVRYLGARQGQTELITIRLRRDQFERLPSVGRTRNSRIVALLTEGLAITDWVTCPTCEQHIKPADTGPYEHTVKARIPVPLARQILDRSMRAQSQIATTVRELLDKALQAEQSS